MENEAEVFLTKLRQGITTDSAEQTRALGAQLAQVLPPDTMLALHGTLGVGKTTFVQGLAKGFGIARQVTSPTYTFYLIHVGTTRQLIHLDAYRLNSPQEVEGLLLEEYLRSPWCLAVEWPEKLGAWLSENAWHLHLAITPDGRHQLRLH